MEGTRTLRCLSWRFRRLKGARSAGSRCRDGGPVSWQFGVQIQHGTAEIAVSVRRASKRQACDFAF